jgi:hypothetical protein
MEKLKLKIMRTEHNGEYLDPRKLIKWAMDRKQYIAQNLNDLDFTVSIIHSSR